MHRRHRRCRVRPRSLCTDRESGRRSSLPGPAPLACVPETANASACPERGSRCLPEAGPSFRPGPSTRGVFGLAQRGQSPVRPAWDTPRGVSALVLSPFPVCEVRERTCFCLRGETGAVAHLTPGELGEGETSPGCLLRPRSWERRIALEMCG